MADVWTVTGSEAWAASIRAELDASLGLSLDYVGTIDGAWTFQGAQLAFEVDQHVADALSGSLLATGSRPVVVARARDRGLAPREATSSTMEIQLATGAGGVLPVGTVLRVSSGTMSYLDTASGGVTVPISTTWTVTENLNPGELLGLTDTVIVESDHTGQVTPDGTLTFSPAAPVSGIGTLTGTTLQTTGRDAESLPNLRLRLSEARSQIGGSPPGLVSAVLAISWVEAAGLIETPGHVRISVTPAPPTTADEATLVAAIYATKAGGVITLGAESATTEGADGRDVTIYYDIGTTQTVTVALTVTPDDTVTAVDALSLGQQAIRDVFAALSPGESMLYLRAIGAVDQPGIKGAVLTLDGGTVDVLPSTATSQLVPVFS